MATPGVFGAAALLAACASTTPAFHPAGSISHAAGPAALSPTAAGAGANSEFETPLPPGTVDRAIMLGYEQYARARWARRATAGPVQFFDMAVTGVYFGKGAAVSSCVDVAGLRYLQVAAEGRRADGSWIVTHVATYPASTSQGASCQ